MDRTNIRRIDTYREEKFRVPWSAERRLGLWVDRIGEGIAATMPQRLRILGQHCAIHIVEGSGEYVSAKTGTISVRPGDCMLQFPEDPCLYGPHKSWKTRWVTFNGPEADVLETLGYVSNSLAVFADSDDAVSEAFNALSGIMREENAASALRRKTIVLEMINKLALEAGHRKKKRVTDPLIEQMIHIIRKQYAENLTIPELAARVNLSPTHFRRLFRDYTSRSPREYITSLRITEAKRLLSLGQPIKEVADRLGYSDIFYFMRVFRKVIGVPPARFARSV